MRRELRLAVVSVLSLAAIGAGGVLSGAQADSTNVLSLSADGAIGALVRDAEPLALGGDTSVDIDVVGVNGGRVSLVPGPGLLQSAVRFPSYDDDGATYPRAALSLTPTAGGALAPGSGNFVYSGLYKLDAVSSGGASDNGDNLFQRGVWSEDSMFKLQVDRGYPACVVKGSLGLVSVKSPTRVERDVWYRTTCRRVGDTVSVSVNAYGSTDVARTEASGEIGELSFRATRPASIGGKVDPDGDLLQSASDQFNGAVAQVWINAS